METVPATDRETRFLELARAVGDPLRRFVVRRADHATAEDALADTMLVLWRRLDDVPEDNPLPWCYAVARGCLANAHRSGRRQQKLADKLATVRPVTEPDDDPGLHEALARLSTEDQELLHLWAWEQLQPHEIAVVLGVTANAVSIRLHRARRKLADLLGNGRKDQPGSGQEELNERRPR